MHSLAPSDSYLWLLWAVYCYVSGVGRVVTDAGLGVVFDAALNPSSPACWIPITENRPSYLLF